MMIKTITTIKEKKTIILPTIHLVEDMVTSKVMDTQQTAVYVIQTALVANATSKMRALPFETSPLMVPRWYVWRHHCGKIIQAES